MKVVHFYDLNTGLIMDHELRGACPDFDAFVRGNTPAGHAPIYGVTDPLSQRVDLETQKIIDYQPPRPDDNREWDPPSRRWVLREDVAELNLRRAHARDRIDELERKQARRVRELLAASDPMLKEIDDQIAAHRAVLTETQQSGLQGISTR